MSKHRKTLWEQHHRSRRRRREFKALRRSFTDLGEAWAGLGISMGTNALRGVVDGMRATAKAIAVPPNTNSPEEKSANPNFLRNWTEVASTWAEAGLAMGKVALEKSAEGLEMTAAALENTATAEKPQESEPEVTSDKPTGAQET